MEDKGERRGERIWEGGIEKEKRGFREQEQLFAFLSGVPC